MAVKLGTKRNPFPWSFALGEAERASLKAFIESRCEEVGDCLVYQRAYTINCWHPELEKRQPMAVRRAYWLAQGKTVPPGHLVVCTCNEPGCVLHLKCATREKFTSMQFRGSKQSAAHIEKKRQPLLARSVYSDELIELIRSTPRRDPETGERVSNVALAKRLNVPLGIVSGVRRGNYRLPRLADNPWAGLMRGGA